MTVRCHKCSASFIPLPLLDEDDAPLPPPPLPGTGRRRTSIAKRELHGGFRDRLGESRRSTFVVLGILLAGMVGLWASWYVGLVHSLERDSNRAHHGLSKKVEELASEKGDRVEIPTTGKKFSGRLKPDEKGKDLTTLEPPAQPKKPAVPDLFTASREKEAFNRTFSKAAQPLLNTANGLAPLAIQPREEPPARPARPVESAADRKARNLLEQARNCEEEARPMAAFDLYQQIVSRFPDTQAARTVQSLVGKPVDRDLVKARSSLFQAQKLEKTGTLSEAKAKYEEIVSRCPKSEPAKSARERLAELARKSK